MAYSKLHSSLVNSSLWCERDDVRILFITMLALADRDGYVWGSRAGIHRQANLKLPLPEDLDEGEPEDPFNVLMEPDCCSSDLLRNPANEGRRIEEVEGGFHIINYEYYRGLRNDDDRKIQNREAQRRHRKKVSQGKPASATVSQRQQSPSASASDSEEYIKELSTDSTYVGINVKAEFGKMTRWCEVNHKHPTKRRFINWLNRAERPLVKKDHGPFLPSEKKRPLDKFPEPSEEEREKARIAAQKEISKLKEQFRNPHEQKVAGQVQA